MRRLARRLALTVVLAAVVAAVAIAVGPSVLAALSARTGAAAERATGLAASPVGVVVGAVLGVGAGAVVAGAVLRRLGSHRIRDWRDAEQATARWLRNAGCRQVRLTAPGADAGIDVLTADWAVQVKHTSKPVGRPAVQQLVGAALDVDRRPALFSTSGFTGPACRYAQEHDVALFVLGTNGRARGLNGPARQVGSRLGRIGRDPMLR